MRNNVASPWDNPKRVVALRELWAEGHSTAEIGRRINVSKNSVISKAHQLDLAPRPSPIRPRDGSAYVAPPKQPGAWEMALARAEQRRREVVHSEQQIALPLAAVMPPAWHAPAPAPRLMAFGAEGCRWIAGEPQGRLTVFCEAVRQVGSSYCPTHHQRCWVPAEKKRRQDAAAAG